MSAIVSMIVAVSENGVIGRNNALPWKLSGDLQYFRKVTWGKPIIMGRKTFESLQRPLPGRTNIVLTRDRDYQAVAGVKIVNNIDKAIKIAQAVTALDETNEIMIIGGAQLYAMCIEYAQRLYITEVHAQIPGDAYFDRLDPKRWKEVSRERVAADEQSTCDYSFVVYERLR